MFKHRAKIGADPQLFARQWYVYSIGNGQTVELNPLLPDEYKLAAGESTLISALQRREVQRWHVGRLNGATVPQLIVGSCSAI